MRTLVPARTSVKDFISRCTSGYFNVIPKQELNDVKTKLSEDETDGDALRSVGAQVYSLGTFSRSRSEMP
jgi:hypothetical protein